MINIPKGTKDVLPFEAHKWHYVEGLAREVARLYNYKEIRTPVFEHTELFLRGVGQTTDIVNKEMYTFADKKGRSITLKPEGTAGVVRSFIESMGSESLPLKMYYITPVFRYENPQAGRLREHHQFGVELFGVAAATGDAEVICMAQDFLTRAGVKDLRLMLNILPTADGRINYNNAMKEYLGGIEDKLCPKCRERAQKNPLRVLDCKEQTCQEVLSDAPKTIDYLTPEDAEHFEALKNLLKSRGVKYEVSAKIVRGLDYYTRTVFEFVSDTIGAQGTVCGGGRYDFLVESLGGKPTPAVGFGLGLERLLMVLENAGKEIAAPKLDCFIAAHPDVFGQVDYLVFSLRKEGVSADCDFAPRGLKAQFKYADKAGARFVIIAGEEEISSKQFTVKDLTSGSSVKIDSDTVIAYIKEQLKNA